MDRMIYTAMTGANATAYRQQLLANNLANASTPGFRAELATFRAVPVRGDGSSSRVFALEATAGHSDIAGPVNTTGRSLDVAARGNAWFAVQGLDGTEAYTRGGAFEVSADGALVTSHGLPVLDDGGSPINVPANAQLEFGADGTLTARVGEQAPTRVGKLKLVTPDAEKRIERSPDGLFRPLQGEALDADPNARVQGGALEGSNVNPIEAMVGMIAASRQFEMQMRMMQNGETNDKTASQLLSMNG
ncbi:MAG: flagellar basal-body rod protein FlgF [Hydrogenophaga sp.]|uniref:flagellar basal-body rod protein FlgF n=1 Tax=Hydrogenophaga sp. TaxID=1904254 RepID=UPI001A42A599|nr:flagellar basal-body rod protein FlgF [Hydrogenophaga sp.]